MAHAHRRSEPHSHGIDRQRLIHHLQGLRDWLDNDSGRKKTPLLKTWRKAAKTQTRPMTQQGGAATLGEALSLSPEIDQNLINAAYEAELNRFSGIIAAAETDLSKTPEERAATVRALRQRQMQSAAAARLMAMDAEKQRVKAERRRQRPAPKRKAKGNQCG